LLTHEASLPHPERSVRRVRGEPSAGQLLAVACRDDGLLVADQVGAKITARTSLNPSRLVSDAGEPLVGLLVEQPDVDRPGSPPVDGLNLLGQNPAYGVDVVTGCYPGIEIGGQGLRSTLCTVVGSACGAMRPL
jgi:hypothetical protein